MYVVEAGSDSLAISKLHAKLFHYMYMYEKLYTLDKREKQK